MTIPKLAIIIPCYNEADVILSTVQIMSQLLTNFVKSGSISKDSFLLFIDDGSVDNTFSLLQVDKSDSTKILKLTKNKGHQYALLAGLQYVYNKVDCCISIDADLQDDLRVIEQMLIKFKGNSHIVCGVRKNRDTDSYFKKKSAQLFYYLMEKLGVRLIKNHADFRLLSNYAIGELLKYKEFNLFLRGIFPNITLNICTIEYVQGRRKMGTTKYSLVKMISLAIQGITSFSTTPIRIITMIGLLIFIVCIVMSANVLLIYLKGHTVPGWASITLPLYFLGGVQIFSVGIIGEYIAKIYKETKRRPHYHIEEIIE